MGLHAPLTGSARAGRGAVRADRQPARAVRRSKLGDLRASVVMAKHPAESLAAPVTSPFEPPPPPTRTVATSWLIFATTEVHGRPSCPCIRGHERPSCPL